MKIGVRAHDFGKQSPELLASAIKRAGYNAVQLAPYKALDIHAEEMIKPAKVARIRDAFSNEGVGIAVLGCYVEPGSMEDDVYRASFEKFRSHIQIAKDIGASCVATETTPFKAPESEREKAYARVLAFVREMAGEAERYDTAIAIEPVLTHTIHTPAMMARLIQQVSSPRLKVIFDPINLLSPIEAEKQGTLWQTCFDQFGGRITALHVKDGRFENGQYIPLPLGEGIMDFKPVMDWVRVQSSEIPLLREEANPALAQKDILFLRGF